MRFQILVMSAAIIVAIVALLSSKYVRAVIKEVIVHPRERCDITVEDGKVSVERVDGSRNPEG